MLPFTAWAQLPSTMEDSPTESAEGYYQFPIRTGNQNFLSGTMGELRSSHFHAGLDIKTQGTEGLEVYAAATGYVSRIKVSSGGYGNALYILHPNGTTSVYAHLQKYNKQLAAYVRENQYAKESFEVEMYPEKNQFKVSKGEVIGYSGNSGSSGGPHLHFEIRDAQQRPLNPLKYGFSEIRDNISPEVRRIALRTMDPQSRINNRFGRFEFRVLRQGNKYTVPVPITAHGNIGVEILTHDKLNGANNRNGVPCMELKLDDQQAFQQNLNQFKFSETRSILIHTDYKTAQEKGQRFVKMYVDDGNELPFYETNDSKGLLSIAKDSTHKIQVNLWDLYNNHSEVNFEISGVEPQTILNLSDYSNPSKVRYQLSGNTLKVEAPKADEETCAVVFANRMQYQLDAAYQINNTAIFLWPMDRGLPDSLVYLDQQVSFDYKAIIPGGSMFNYYGDHIKIHAPTKALFDTVFLTYDYRFDEKKQQEVFGICENIYPIRRNLTITLQPQMAYPDKDRSAVYLLDKRGNPSFTGGQWKGRDIEFKTRNWGKYTILTDTLNPEVRALILNKDQLVFRIRDKLSGIDSYRLLLDGKWVLMNYDYKKDIIRSEKLDNSIPFSGELTLEVTDNVGNTKKYRTKI